MLSTSGQWSRRQGTRLNRIGSNRIGLDSTGTDWNGPDRSGHVAQWWRQTTKEDLAFHFILFHISLSLSLFLSHTNTLWRPAIQRFAILSSPFSLPQSLSCLKHNHLNSIEPASPAAARYDAMLRCEERRGDVTRRLTATATETTRGLSVKVIEMSYLS